MFKEKAHFCSAFAQRSRALSLAAASLMLLPAMSGCVTLPSIPEGAAGKAILPFPAVNRRDLLAMADHLFDSDEAVNSIDDLPAGSVDVRAVPVEVWQPGVRLYVRHGDHPFYVSTGSTKVSVPVDAQLVAQIQAPISKGLRDALSVVDGFDIRETTDLDATLRSLPTGDIRLLIIRDLVLTESAVATINTMVTLKSLLLYGDESKFFKRLQLPQIEFLELRAVEPIADFPVVIDNCHGIHALALKSLRLSTPLVDAITRLPALDFLWLNHCNVDDRQIARLLAGRELQLLELHDTSITDQGMVAIGKQTTLWRLNISRCDIGDPGLKQLSKASNLQILDLGNTNVSDQGIKYLMGLKLRSLNLEGTHITEKALPHLAKMQTMKKLGLKRSQVGAEDLHWLRQKLPNCVLH